MRQTQERMLAALLEESKHQQANKREQKLAKKYHMVKFFGVFPVTDWWSGGAVCCKKQGH